ncbi:hypothetical protein NQ176_g7049 [Zarea fungicola]|uniref:Uncharacterized protein n=1 Tax=Zarea fungicola TaxID=93591 RepID=A0ACC1N051_9HYPO|nr:hypothetical protein NQ176_g7049 [Lecanicillium fungicola]
MHQAYVKALQNVLPNPDKCEWDKILDSGLFDSGLFDSGLDQKRDIVDFVADCKIALQGTMNLLGSPDVVLQQKYSND